MRDTRLRFSKDSAAGLALLTPGAALCGSFTAAGYYPVPAGTTLYAREALGA